MSAGKPFRRPTLPGGFGCVALLANGRRCGRAHFSEAPITFTWDPVKGRGIGGPSACFCRMHDYFSFAEGSERFQVVGGWIGRAWNPDAQVWTVLVTVYEGREGFYVSKHWWALRRETIFGKTDRVTYDQAVGA